MEEKKRKGYKTMEQQKEADKRYLEKHPEAKEKKKISAMKSNAKRFIKEFAKIEDLEELENLIKDKKMEVLKMKELKKVYAEWRKVSEEMLEEGFKGSIDCGDKAVREDFSSYAELQEIISFEEMLELEEEYNKNN